jgi:hypothetical protein
VNDAEDLRHAVRRHAIEDQMARLCHPVLGRKKPPNRPEMERSQASHARYLAGAGKGGGISNHRSSR